MSQRLQNILFAAVGLQVGALDAQQIRNGLEACGGELPFADWLIDESVLDDQQRTALSAIASAQLKRHAGDVSVAVDEMVSEMPELQRIVSQNDVDTSVDDDNTSDFATVTGEPALAPPPVPNRFRIVRFHDEGALGQVFEAEDQELHRRVALKEIQQRFVGDTANRLRFEREAQITGRLEHPGIVPVYGMGHHDDGRPYYAMRMIRGRSLKDAIQEFHGTRWNTRDAGERTVQLRRLLSSFMDVCNAIHYAHRRGVIHRDIKPSNIMLGKYGEALVVDWGLAKAMDVDGRTDDPDGMQEELLQLQDEASLLQTMAGRAVGTPLFMSPEQARGDQENVGPAADIYSLGATLYALLANAPPISAANRKELLKKIQLGQIPNPRTSNPTIAKPLAAICLKALALAPENRYATAEALRQDVERYLAEETVSAYRENTAERLWRFVRQHRVGVVSALATLAILAVSTIGYVLWSAEQRDKVQAEEMWGAMESVVDDYSAVRPDRKGRTVTHVELLNARAAKLDKKYLQPTEGYHVAAHAVSVDSITKDLLIEQEYEKTIEVAERHLPIIEKNDPDPLVLTSIMDHLAHAYSLNGETQQAVARQEEVVRIRRQINAPDRLITALNNLAGFLDQFGDYSTAFATRQEIVQLYEGRVGCDQSRLNKIENIALANLSLGRFTEARKYYLQAQELCFQYLPDHHLRLLDLESDLIFVDLESGREDAAMAAYRNLYQRAMRELEGKQEMQLLYGTRFADCLLAAGHVEEALVLTQQLFETDWENFEGRLTKPVLRALDLHTRALIGNKRFDDAIKILQNAFAIARNRFRVEMSLRQANAKLRQGEFRTAASLYEKVVAQLSSFFAPNQLINTEAALGYVTALSQLGKFSESVDVLERLLGRLGKDGFARMQRCRLMLALADAQIEAGDLRSARETVGQLEAIVEMEFVPQHFRLAKGAIAAELAFRDDAESNGELVAAFEALCAGPRDALRRFRYSPRRFAARVANSLADFDAIHDKSWQRRSSEAPF